MMATSLTRGLVQKAGIHDLEPNDHRKVGRGRVADAKVRTNTIISCNVAVAEGWGVLLAKTLLRRD